MRMPRRERVSDARQRIPAAGATWCPKAIAPPVVWRLAQVSLWARLRSRLQPYHVRAARLRLRDTRGILNPVTNRLHDGVVLAEV